MTQSNIVTHNLLQNDLRYFAKVALKIKSKATGQLIPFEFNRAQEYLHERIKEQKKKTGRVRLIILKGRQQGMSTYIAARDYHLCTRNKGVAVFILSHDSQTTAKLFGMVDRFHNNCPEPLRAVVGMKNVRQLKFDVLDSEYTVGTAGNENVGRGGTLQLLHCSEMAFYENTDGIETGIMQSVSDSNDTEIIIESTANGMGNMFHRKCMAAMRGEGDYELVFIPWYWQKEYSRPITQYRNRHFEMNGEEAKLKEAYKLTNGQILWRRNKIEEFGSTWKFRREYPMSINDAFVSTGDSLILGDKILSARKAMVSDPNAPLILGVDMAREKDRVVIMPRRGREVLSYTVFDPQKEGLISQTVIAGRLINMIDRMGVDKIFIDNAKGYGVVDILKDSGYGNIITGVYFSEGAIEQDRFLNKRAEMHINARDWFDDEVSIPDKDELEVDMAAIPNYKENMNGLIKMVSKDDIKKELGRSPDLWDAFILTFAQPVARTKGLVKNRGSRLKKVEGKSGFKTLRRVQSKHQEDYIGTRISLWN